jgi:hypothetical protein
MKWWKLALGMAALGGAAMLVAGRGDIMRRRRMRRG